MFVYNVYTKWLCLIILVLISTSTYLHIVLCTMITFLLEVWCVCIPYLTPSHVPFCFRRSSCIWPRAGKLGTQVCAAPSHRKLFAIEFPCLGTFTALLQELSVDGLHGLPEHHARQGNGSTDGKLGRELTLPRHGCKTDQQLVFLTVVEALLRKENKKKRKWS